jgi:hypothetical protein
MYASATEASILSLFLHFCVRALEFSQLGSTNGTALAHPYVPRMEGAQSYAALARRILVERFCPTYIVTQGPLSPTLYIRSEKSPSHIAARRNSSTVPALAIYSLGQSLEPSWEEAAQSIHGSHDSSCHLLALSLN